MGFEPEMKPLAFFQDDYGLKVEGGEIEMDGMETDELDEADEDDDKDEDEDDDMSDKDK